MQNNRRHREISPRRASESCRPTPQMFWQSRYVSLLATCKTEWQASKQGKRQRNLASMRCRIRRRIHPAPCCIWPSQRWNVSTGATSTAAASRSPMTALTILCALVRSRGPDRRRSGPFPERNSLLDIRALPRFRRSSFCAPIHTR